MFYLYFWKTHTLYCCTSLSGLLFRDVLLSRSRTARRRFVSAPVSSIIMHTFDSKLTLVYGWRAFSLSLFRSHDLLKVTTSSTMTRLCLGLGLLVRLAGCIYSYCYVVQEVFLSSEPLAVAPPVVPAARDLDRFALLTSSLLLALDSKPVTSVSMMNLMVSL